MKLRTLLPALVLLLLGACGRESSDRLELLVEPLGPAAGTKLAVQNDVQAVWTTGDIINLNGERKTVATTDAGQASVSGIVQREVNSACFPADLAGANDLSADEINMTLPAEYHYRTSGSAQLLDLPMVGRSPAGEPLQMRHITAALCVVLENQMGVSLTIDRITVTSDTSDSYQLSGSRTVDMENITSTAAVATDNETDRKVAMVFDREALVLANGELRKVLIPVPPVGDSNHFTISVSARHEGSRYTYSRTQTHGGALERNVLAYAPVAVSGVPATPLFEPTGSSGQYYIRNSSDLVALSEAANGDWTLPGSTTKYSACKYRLAADIDMTDVPFSMISNYSNDYFYGDNHVISHLTIDGADGYCGLFKNPSGIVIENLTLNDITLHHPAFTVANGSVYLGALCAHAPAGANFTSCHVNGLKVEHGFTGKAGQVYFGGFVGRLDNGGTLNSCSISIDSIACSFDAVNCYFGGLLGYSACNEIILTIEGCSVVNSGPTITSTQNMFVGGFVSFSSNKKNIKLINCNWRSKLNVVSTHESSTNVYVGRYIGRYFINGTAYNIPIPATATAEGSINVTLNGNTTNITADVGGVITN